MLYSGNAGSLFRVCGKNMINLFSIHRSAAYPVTERRFYCEEIISLLLILCTGTVIAFTHRNIGNGIIQCAWFERIRTLTHGYFPCPFCGATRAFVYACRFHFSTACHYNIFGFCCYFFFWIHLIAKSILVLSESARKNNNIAYFLKMLNSCVPVICCFTAMYLVQITLHYTNIFRWNLLE